MTLILALASSNFCEYGPKNDPYFDRPKMTLILALALACSNFCEYGPKNDPNFSFSFSFF